MGNNWAGSNNSRTSISEHRAWAKAVLERDQHQCQIRGPRCRITATEADHITPHAQGGQLELSNGQAVCAPCHLQKTSAEANTARWGASITRPQEVHPGLR